MATYLINQLRENSVFRAFKHRSVALIMEQPFSMECVLLSTCVFHSERTAAVSNRCCKLQNDVLLEALA